MAAEDTDMLRNVCMPFLLALLLLPLVSPSAARATTINFCFEDSNPSETNCIAGKVVNSASITVSGFTIKQIESDDCTAEENVHRGNLAGAGGSVDTVLDLKCAYHVKFRTSSGCIGDKDATISLKDIGKKHTLVELLNGCGTLKAKAQPNNSLKPDEETDGGS
jgi:hypothetical protein